MCGEYDYRIQIVILWVQAVSWGIYMALFCFSIYILLEQQRNKWFVVVSTLNFSLATFSAVAQSVAIVMTRTITCDSSCLISSTCLSCAVPSSEDIYQNNVWNVLQVIVPIPIILSQLVADGFLIWRCFTVWNNNIWIVIFPSMCLLGATASGFYTAYCNSVLYRIELRVPTMIDLPPQWYEYNSKGSTAGLVNLSLSLATNVLITSLTVGKILHTTRWLRRPQSVNPLYSSVIFNLIESGALISLTYVAAIIVGFCTAMGPEAYIVDTILGQIIGIAPTLLIIQLALPTPTIVALNTVKGLSHVSDAPMFVSTASGVERDGRRTDRPIQEIAKESIELVSGASKTTAVGE